MFKFTIKLLKSNPKKSGLIVFEIAFFVMLMFSLIQMGNSMLLKYKEFLDDNANQDFKIINIDEVISEKLINSIKDGGLGEEVDAYALKAYVGEFQLSEEESIKTSLCAADEKPISIINNFQVKSGTFPQNAYEIAIDEGANNKLDTPLSVGDKVTLLIKDNQDNTYSIEFLVSGFMDNTKMQSLSKVEQNFAFTSFHTIKELEKIINFKHGNYSLDIMFDQNSFDSDKIYNAIRKFHPIITPEYNKLSEEFGERTLTDQERALLLKTIESVEVNSAKESAYTEKEDNDSVGLSFFVLAIIVAVTTFLLVFNSINRLMIERISQFGMSKHQLTKMLLWEVLIYSLLGISLGIVLGVFLNQIVGRTIMSLLIDEVKLVHTYQSYLFTFTLAVAFIFLAAFKIKLQLSKKTSN